MSEKGEVSLHKLDFGSFVTIRETVNVLQVKEMVGVLEQSVKVAYTGEVETIII